MAHYKVIGFDESSGSLIVQFDENMAPLAVDVPINNQGLYITGEELDQYVKGFIPTWHIDRLNKIKSGVSNVNDLKSLVTELSAPENVVTEEELQAQRETLFEQKVIKVLAKFNLITN